MDLIGVEFRNVVLNGSGAGDTELISPIRFGFGYYWSSSHYTSEDGAYLVHFNSGALNPANYFDRDCGFSVRLVCDVQ